MEKVTRTYNITKELSDKLRDASFHLQIPQSEIVREALELYLSHIAHKMELIKIAYKMGVE